MTPVSHSRRPQCDKPRHCRLARRSLLWGLVAGALNMTGCILAEPPPYQAPEQTAPWLDLATAVPSVYQVLPLSTASDTQQLRFNVPVRSEDAGDELFFAFFLNWNTDEEIGPVGKGKVEASTPDKQDRAIITVWDYSGVMLAPGCSHLTLMVTHLANWDITRDAPYDWGDVAVATWTLNVDDAPPGTNTLSDCPRSLGGVQ